MHVETAEAIPLSYPLPDGRTMGSARGQTDHRFATLVRLETADGTVGWGDALAAPRTAATYLDEQLLDDIVGMDPIALESLADRQLASTAEQRGTFAQCGLSAVEMALWDLKGKAFGYPVAELLGGRRCDHVTPYASTMYVTDPESDPAAAVAAAVEEGFTAIKIKIGRGVEDDVHRVEIARDALGPDGDLMVDYNGNYRPAQAIESIRAIEPYDITWAEEPVPPEDLDGYRDLRRHVTVPIAAGEAHYGRFAMRELLEVVDVVQPDLGRCGGLSEARFIAKLATTTGAVVHPHVWNSGVGIAAAVQFVAARPAFPHVTNEPEPRYLEFDRAENPLRHEILDTPFDPSGGTVAVPDGPGLGITVDEDAVERYRIPR